MNYRHAFHAGNFADVLKHILLAHCLDYLIRKPSPVRYIDTHAGLGWYDLDSEEARRTGEWRSGVGRLKLEDAPEPLHPLLAPYFAALGPLDSAGQPTAYPGSPAIAQHVLRKNDVLLLSELHPADGAELRRNIKGDKRVKVLTQDGYRTLNAALPPPERRGLVLIDPPFEERDEFDRMADAVEHALRKWPGGTYLIWYPIKDLKAVAGFRRRMEALMLPSWLDLSLTRPHTSDEMSGLAACGVYAVNPPYTLHVEAEPLLRYLASSFSEPGHPAWHGQAQGRSA